jgi:RHS repeat-associated protein
VGDHLGSVTVLAQGGSVAGATRYLPYGAIRLETGVWPTDRRFTGQRWEQGLGLYDYNARFYDPALGRFLQPDPIVPEPGNPQALNRYAYVYNNPLRYTDPSGHVPVILVMMGIGAVSGALINYGVQVAANISQNGLTVQAFTHVNLASIGASALAGAVGGATFYGASAVFAAATGATGIGLGNMVLSGALSGALSGQVERATANVLEGRPVGEGLGKPEDILLEAALGGGMAFAGGVVDRAVMAARFPGYYTRYVGEGEIAAIQQTGLLRGGRPGETYFTIDRYVSKNSAMQRLALKHGPEYRVEFEIINQPSIVGPERVAPSLKPFRWGWGIQHWARDPVQVRILRFEFYVSNGAKICALSLL